jgi:undecaprenyl-diphosphatase
MRSHDVPEDFMELLSVIAVPAFAVAVALLWLLDRPGTGVRFRRASLSAVLAAGLALAIDQVIAQVWLRERPAAVHPHETFLVIGPSTDPSFPSDHAAAAFAIAFTVWLVSRKLGAAFLVGAAVVAMSRVFVGLHYPSDIAAGAVVGLLAALLVAMAAGSRIDRVALTLSRATDPAANRVWAATDALRERRRATHR